MANPRSLNGVSSPQSVYQTSTTAYHRVGARGILDDRIFHYACLSGTTGVVANNLVSGIAPNSAHTTETGTLTNFTVGSSQFTAVLGASAAIQNEYAEGYIKIESSTLGAGQIYKLRDHEAVASAGTATFLLYDPVVTTPTGTVTWSLIHNPWAHVVISPVTTIVAMSAGVPLVTVPAAAATTTPVFFWAQTWGPCSVLGDTSDTVVGSQVVTSAVVGSIGVGTGLLQAVGNSLEAMATNTVYQSVYLTIAP